MKYDGAFSAKEYNPGRISIWDALDEQPIFDDTDKVSLDLQHGETRILRLQKKPIL